MKSLALPLALLALLLLSGLDSAQGERGSPPGGVTFSDVAPVFQKYCLTCHSGPRPPKGLRLDSYENIMMGGDTVINPGDPQRSELFRRITGVSKPRMPRNGPPWVPDAEIDKIGAWIEAEAPK